MRSMTEEQAVCRMRHAHHLDRKLPRDQILEAASACGFVNSPPGSWELAVRARVEAVSRNDLHRELIETKRLMQAWSLRGAPTIFPTAEAGTFLGALAAQEDEVPIYAQPLSYTAQALKADQKVLLEALRQACRILDDSVVVGKAQLDHVLAEAMKSYLPPSVRSQADEPSLVAKNQTLLEAAVSYLLRQCSLEGRVMMGERQKQEPVFLSPSAWFGSALDNQPQPQRIVDQFLHCYGPASVQDFARWTGCSRMQAQRLWALSEAERIEVDVQGQRGWMLKADLEELDRLPQETSAMQLLGTHDPFLDLPQRSWILTDPAAQKKVWRLVGSPGVVLHKSQIVGIWNAPVQKGKAQARITLFKALTPAQRDQVCAEMIQLQGFLQRPMGTCDFLE